MNTGLRNFLNKMLHPSHFSQKTVVDAKATVQYINYILKCLSHSKEPQLPLSWMDMDM